MHLLNPSDRARRFLPAAAAVLVSGSLLATSPASASPAASPGVRAGSSTVYTYSTLGDNADTAFNQLLGINDQQVIAGYDGDGATVPNKGYTVVPPYAQSSFRNENFPHSAQTQVTGLNDTTTTVGFYVNSANDQIGFVHTPSGYTSVSDPGTPTTGTTVNQLLGVNNNGIAVGFYNNSSGNSVPYEYDIASKTYTTISIPDEVSAFATGINDQGDVSGTSTRSNGSIIGWEIVNGTYHPLNIGTKLHSVNLTASGINDVLQVVGFYTDSTGATHGFVDNNGSPQTINEPGGNGYTVVNGINNGESWWGSTTRLRAITV